MKVAIVGLGKMGHQIAVKLQQAGHEITGVVLFEEQVVSLAAEGIQATTSRQAARDFFGNDTPVVWLMIPAEGVDAELAQWLELLPAGSIVIDGGNSDFRKTTERARLLAEHSISLVDVGTSGGVHGIMNGFSMMVGGEAAAFAAIEPILTVLVTPNGGYKHFGQSGSGHYIKMVHNAIEYGMMESVAEGYRMLKEGAYADQIDLAAVGEVWQQGSVVQSWLNHLTQQALVENPTLEGIEGYVAESGEARWTLEDAAERGIALPVIQAAFDVRRRSQQGDVHFGTKLLAAMRNKFGGHEVNQK